MAAAELAARLDQLLPDYLIGRRWCTAAPGDRIHLRRLETLVEGPPSLMWGLVSVVSATGDSTYQVLLGATATEPDGLPERAILGSVTMPSGTIWIYDGLADPTLATAWVRHIAPDHRVRRAEPLEVDSTNTNLVVDGRYVAKLFRRLQPGPNPDVEVTEALGRVGFGGVPVPQAVWRRDNTDLAVLRPFIDHRGEALELCTESLDELFRRRVPPRSIRRDIAEPARALGEAVARLHLALASALGTYQPDPAAWAADMITHLNRVGHTELDFGRIEAAYRRLAGAADLGSAIRVHGDLHLGQILRRGGGARWSDWVVIDFEGEPARPAEERRRPSSPLRDVAGMTRSFEYAAGMARRSHPEGRDPELGVLAAAWIERATNHFLTGYASVDEVHRLLPSTRAARDALLSVFELDKAVYEVGYELAHRPQLANLPAAAVERLLSTVEGEEEP